jgi:hypothetical protein
MAVCVAAFALTSLATRQDGTQVNQDFTDFFQYYTTRPYPRSPESPAPRRLRAQQEFETSSVTAAWLPSHPPAR